MLAKDPKRIDIQYLTQFPEFKASRDGSGKPTGGRAPLRRPPLEQTPEEAFESSYQSIRA